MKISTILDHIDSGHMALPEFQRGYVWNRDQVRALFNSLYRGHPVGGLLVWAAESGDVSHRGDGQLAPGVIKLLLDGQQRITSLYGVLRGKPPAFFDGNVKTFTDLYFHLESEVFSFYQHSRMAGDTLWISVSEFMKESHEKIGGITQLLQNSPEHTQRIGDYIGRLAKLLSIKDVELHIDEVTEPDIDIVVDIFNRVNSSGTRLSKGDLALAKICAKWPEAREELKSRLERWNSSGYGFSLDWLLRSVNTVSTGEASFSHLHDKNAEDIRCGLARASKAIGTILDMIGGRLGLDRDSVFFGDFAIPVMAHYLDRNISLDGKEWDKLLFWYVQAGMWGRFSGSTETMINQDLAAIEESEGALDNLIEKLRLWHGGLRVEAAHFSGWNVGARFYRILYMLTRMGAARDWGTGLPLKAGMLGKMSALELHHIFPKSQLYKHGYDRPQVNALANFCFLSKGTNLAIRDRFPEAYFPRVEANHPGALVSQWIPMDPTLWKIENYRDFLEARKNLLAEETNLRLIELLHGDEHWTKYMVMRDDVNVGNISVAAPSDVIEDEEDHQVEILNKWMEQQGCPRGIRSFDFADTNTGEQKAVFDLAWPDGVQRELSQPVAVLLNETADVLSLANGAGYRCFTRIEDFKRYVGNLLSGQESVQSFP